MTTTNDAMFVELSARYPTAGQTLGDLLYAFWVENGLQFRGTLQSTVFTAGGATGATLGDLTNSYFSDHDFLISNLDLEDGNDFLLEDGTYILMEIGNAG